MRGCLLDTNVISEYNRETGPHAGVAKWMETTPEPLQYVSVLTLAEIEKGILRKEDGRRRRELQRWLDEDLQAPPLKMRANGGCWDKHTARGRATCHAAQWLSSSA